jgi:hypothetical protein
VPFIRVLPGFHTIGLPVPLLAAWYCFFGLKKEVLLIISFQGVSVRVVECQYLLNNSGAPDEMCSALEKPPTEKSCSAALAVCIGSPISHSVSVEHNHTSKMPQWRTGSWGSVTFSLQKKIVSFFERYIIKLFDFDVVLVLENLWRRI